MRLLNALSGLTGCALMLCTASGALPDLAPVALEVPPALTNVPNPLVTLAWAVTNQGSGVASGSWADGIYIATKPVLDNTALFVSSFWYGTGPLAPGDIYWTTNTLSLPVVSNGTYYAILNVDAFGFLAESNETNNLIVASFFFEATPADLAALALDVPPTITGPPNLTITVSYGVTNQGQGTALGFWQDALYFSTNATWTPDALYLSTFNHPPTLDAGQSYWQTNSVQLPVVTSGRYYLFFKTDVYDNLYEADLSNNMIAAPVLVTIQYPDLAPVKLQVPSLVTGLPNPSVSFVWGVTNQGEGLAVGYWNDRFYVSTNATLHEGVDPIFYYSYESGPVAPGGSYWHTNAFQVPVAQNGAYHLFFKADADNTLFESNTTNNVTSVQVTFDLQHPDLVPLQLQAPTVVTSAPNPSVTVAWGVTNQGDGSALRFWIDSLYLSKNAVLDSSDAFISNQYEYGPIDSGEIYWRTNTFSLPIVQSGTYYLIFTTDSANSIFESDTNNNTIALPITLTILPPDLAAVALQAPASFTGPPNPYIQLAWDVTNQGPGAALGYWYDQVFFSRDSVLDAGDTVVSSYQEAGPVLPGDTYWGTNLVQIPVTRSGTYYLIFQANAGSFSSLYESSYSNNTKVVPITFKVLPPDLAPIASLVPNSVTGPPNPTVTFIWGVTNQGTGAATGSGWYDNIYLSLDGLFNSTDPIISYGYDSGPLAPGGASWQTNTVRVPVTESGTYYLVFVANPDKSLFESDYNNNAAIVPVSFTILPPDLAPVLFQAPALVTGPPNPSLSLAWGVTNQGTGSAVAPPFGFWSDHVYFSKSPTLDSSNNDIFSLNEPGPLAPGQSYWRTNTVRIPVVQSGTYYLIFKIDNYGSLVESNVSNNVAIVSVTFDIQPPDLAPGQLQVPSSVTGPPYPSLTYVWGITNQGAGPAIAYGSAWPDNVYLSTNAVLDWSDAQLGYGYQSGPIPPGAVYWQTNTVNVPVLQSGTYYLIFKTDADGSLVESDYNNNVASVPVTFNILPPDLAPITLQVPAATIGPPNPNLTVVWGVTNQGTGPAGGYLTWSDTLYLSTDAIWDSGDTPIAGQFEAGPVASGDSYWRTNIVRMPVVQSGTYYLIFRTDTYSSLYESDYSNNVVVAPVTFTVLPPDLVPVTSLVPNSVTGPPNPSLTLIWGTTNQGIGLAAGNYSWYDRIYFSTDPKLDWLDQSIAFSWQVEPIAPGSVYWQTNDVTIPVVQTGTYYLIFQANADNSLYESDFSNNVSVVPVTFNIQHPDLAPIALQVPTIITSPPNPTLTIVWGVTNQGVGPALQSSGLPGWSDSLYFSANTNAGLAPITSVYETGPIPPGGVYWRTNTVNVPIVRSGTYYFIFNVDAIGMLYESDYSNNTVAVPVSFTILPPDLAPLVLQVPTVVTSAPNPFLTLSWGVTNQGVGLAEGYWHDAVYLSSNPVLEVGDTAIDTEYNFGPLPPGDGYSRRVRVQVPVLQSGTYYLILQANSGNSLFESDYSNNLAVVPITFNILPPDLEPIVFQTPAIVTGPPNPTINLGWAVTNQGTGTALSSAWADRVYLSTEPVLHPQGDPVVATRYEYGPIAAGYAYWRTQTAQLPVVTNGVYYLIFKTDADNSLYESNETNNTIVAAITVTVQLPDLVPFALQAPDTLTGPPNPLIKLIWGVTNQGVGSATATYWSDNVYLSTDPKLDASDAWLAGRSESGPISPGYSYWRQQSAILPLTQSGLYYLIFQVNGQTYSPLPESNFSNNTIAVPITVNIQPPDLAPIALQVLTVTGAPNFVLTFTYGVTNQGAGSAGGDPLAYFWFDDVFFLTNSVFAPNLQPPIAQGFVSGPIQPGQSYWRTNTVRLPVQTDGTYYLALRVNWTDYPPYYAIYESDFSNNVLVVPFTIHLSPPPDLAPLVLQAPNVLNGPVNPNVTLVWGVTNQGRGSALGLPFPWMDTVFLSQKDAPSGQYFASWSWPETNDLSPGSTYWRTNTVQLPLLNSGSYRLTFLTDADDLFGESDRTNNSVDVSVTFNLVPSDLAVLNLEAPNLVSGPPRSTITVSWGLTNQGVSPAAGGLNSVLYFSSKPFLDSTAYPLSYLFHTNALPPAENYFESDSVRLPPVADGTYYLILQTDPYNYLNESNLTNNIAVVPISITTKLPDLAPVAFQAPGSLTGPPTLQTTLAWGVTNQGAASAGTSDGWMDQLYLSTSPAFDGTESLVAAWYETNVVPAGASYWRTNEVTLTVPYSGTFYLLFQVDHDFTQFDSNYDNNVIATPVTFTILPPDLAPISFQVPTAVTGAPDASVTIVVGVTNQGVGPAVAAVDSLYVSGTPILDWSARLVASWSRTNTIPAGGVYWLTNTVRVPAGDSGNYYLIFQTDVDNALNESDIFNNVAVAPITLDLSLQSDLVADVVQTPNYVVGSAYPNVQLVWHVINQGLGPAVGPWSDSVSIGDTWQSQALVKSFFETNLLMPGGGYWRTNTITLPLTQSGIYFLRFQADAANDLFELDQDNNAVLRTFSFSLESIPPISLGSPRLLSDGSFVLNVYGTLGTSYTLQSSTNLVDWARVADFVCTTFPTTVRDPDAADFSQRFYRVAPYQDVAFLRLAFTASPTPASEGVELKLDGPISRSLSIQASANLHDWVPITNFFNTLSPTCLRDTTATNFPYRFYRAVAP